MCAEMFELSMSAVDELRNSADGYYVSFRCDAIGYRSSIIKQNAVSGIAQDQSQVATFVDFVLHSLSSSLTLPLPLPLPLFLKLLAFTSLHSHSHCTSVHLVLHLSTSSYTLLMLKWRITIYQVFLIRCSTHLSPTLRYHHRGTIHCR